MENINLYGMTLPEKVVALEKAFKSLSEEIKEVSQIAGVSSAENYRTPDYNYSINMLYNPSGDKAINVKANMRVFFANAYYAVIEKIVYDSDGNPYAFNTYQGIDLKGEHGTNGVNGNGITAIQSLRHTTENSETITTVEVVTDESNMEFEVHAQNGSSSIIYNSSQNATISQGGYSVSRGNLSPVLGSPTIDDYVIANIDQNGETKSALFHVLAYNASTSIVTMAFVTYLKGDKGEKGEKGDTNFRYVVQCTITFGADKINIFGISKTSPDMGLIYDSDTFYQAFKQGSDFIGICNGVLSNAFFDNAYNPVFVTEIGVNVNRNIIINAVIIKGHNGDPQHILAEKVTKELSVNSPLFSDFTGIVSEL